MAILACGGCESLNANMGDLEAAEIKKGTEGDPPKEDKKDDYQIDVKINVLVPNKAEEVVAELVKKHAGDKRKRCDALEKLRCEAAELHSAIAKQFLKELGA